MSTLGFNPSKQGNLSVLDPTSSPSIHTKTSSSSSSNNIVDVFRRILKDDIQISMPVAAIKALSQSLKGSHASTVSGFTQDLQRFTEELLEYTHHAVSILAGCGLFARYVTRMASDELTFENFKLKLIEKGEAFASMAENFKRTIAQYGLQFIQDGSNILIHGMSKVVMEVLALAAKHHRRFKVHVTEARPSNQGIKACRYLANLGIPCQIVLDTAVGFYMERMDMVLVGAEGVVENGGLINQIGTYQISILAKAANKPFYALAESYKFVRLFPLNQYDLPSNTSSSADLVASARASFRNLDATSTAIHSTSHRHHHLFDLDHRQHHLQNTKYSDTGENTTEDESQDSNSTLKKETCTSNASSSICSSFGGESNPMVDYTPPSGITLLFTDLGVLTPSGVSDELIKFYY